MDKLDLESTQVELTLGELLLLRRMIRKAQNSPIEEIGDEYWDEYSIKLEITFNTEEYRTLKKFNL